MTRRRNVVVAMLAASSSSCSALELKLKLKAEPLPILPDPDEIVLERVAPWAREEQEDPGAAAGAAEAPAPDPIPIQQIVAEQLQQEFPVIPNLHPNLHPFVENDDGNESDDDNENDDENGNDSGNESDNDNEDEDDDQIGGLDFIGPLRPPVRVRRRNAIVGSLGIPQAQLDALRNEFEFGGEIEAREINFEDAKRTTGVDDNGQEITKIVKSDDMCAVCIEAFSREGIERAGDDLVLLQCGHLFHTGCLGPWFQRHNTCPTCRGQDQILAVFGAVEPQNFENGMATLTANRAPVRKSLTRVRWGNQVASASSSWGAEIIKHVFVLFTLVLATTVIGYLLQWSIQTLDSVLGIGVTICQIFTLPFVVYAFYNIILALQILVALASFGVTVYNTPPFSIYDLVAEYFILGPRYF